MAGVIVEGMVSVDGVEAKAFPIDDVDKDWVAESKAVVIGTPTYMADLCGTMKEWLDGPLFTLGVAGKLGGAFATADYIHGGGDHAVNTILKAELVASMVVFSSGAMSGKPVIHMGPVGIAGKLDESKDTFKVYGERMANKTKELFGE